MKHSDWLRLQTEGESICATLRQQGYLCRKQTRRLSWKLCKEGQVDYVFTLAPTPVSDWTLIPNDTSPQRQQLWQLIERTLTSIREEVIKTLPKRTSQAEDYSRPWAIIRLLPDARCEFNKFNTKSSSHDSFISPHQPRTKIPHHQASNCQILENFLFTNCKSRILALRYLRPSPRQRRTIHQLPPDGTMEKRHCLSTAKMLYQSTVTTLVECN